MFNNINLISSTSDVTGTDSIGALTKSIATTMQITERTSSADGGKRNRRSGRGGDSAHQKQMHILSLTEIHLALLNKENYVIPWIWRENVANFYQGIS